MGKLFDSIWGALVSVFTSTVDIVRSIPDLPWLLPELAASQTAAIVWISLTLGVVLFFGMRQQLQKAERSARIAGEDLTEPSNLDEGEQMQVLDLRAGSLSSADRKSFRNGWREIRKALGLRSPYEVPWYILFGQTSAGKTTALENTVLEKPLGSPEDGTVGLQWWFYDRALALDMRGIFVLEASDDGSNQPGFRGVLRELRRARPRRPLDGIIFALPSTELSCFDASDAAAAENLTQRAEVLRRKLVQIQRTLGVRLPVYVLITESDRLEGYADYAEALPPGVQAQMIGWSAAVGADAEYSPSWLDDAFASLDDALAEQELEVAARGGENELAGMGFRDSIAALQKPVSLYLNRIFSPAALYEPFPMRGVYFSAGEGFGDPGTHPRVSFLNDFFSWKTFFEWSLGRPTIEGTKQRSLWRTLLRGTALALVLLGPLAVLLGFGLSEQRSDDLRQRFLDPATATFESPNTDVVARDQTTFELLQAGNDLESYSLTTWLLPTSFLARLGSRVQDFGVRSWDEITYPSLQTRILGLIDQARNRLAPIPLYGNADSPPGSQTDITTTPEMGQLASAANELAMAEEGGVRYRRLAGNRTGSSVQLRDDMAWMSRSLYSLEWQPPNGSSRRFYGGVLQQAQGDPTWDPCTGSGDVQPKEIASATTSQARRMFDRLYDRPPEKGSAVPQPNNLLVFDLQNLQRDINRLAREEIPVNEAETFYRQVMQSIDRTERDLALPEVAWVGRTPMDLGPAYRQLLGSFSASCFLGSSVADAVDADAQSGFAGYRQRLARFQTDATGTLLKVKDGEPSLALSESVKSLRAFLSLVLEQMEGSQQVTLLQPNSMQVLSWRSAPLKAGVTTLQTLQTFITQQQANFQGLTGVDETVTESMRWKVLEDVLQAQDLREAPSTFAGWRAFESFIALQVQNLQQVSADLSTILAGLRPQNGPAGGCWGRSIPYCQLSEVLERQKATLLSDLYTLLQSRDLYAPRGGDFAWWDGTGNLALQAFDQKDAASLQTYVDAQRQVVIDLETSYVNPILGTIVPETPDDWGLHEGATYLIWQRISQDLQDYTAKTPGNPLATLESFITTTMFGIEGSTCQRGLAEADGSVAPDVPATQVVVASLSPTDAATASYATAAQRCGAGQGCSYFDFHRALLRAGVGNRCDQLTVISGTAAYGRLATTFADRVERKYPFVPKPPTPSTDEARPDDVAGLLDRYALDRFAIETLLALDRRCEAPGTVSTSSSVATSSTPGSSTGGSGTASSGAATSSAATSSAAISGAGSSSSLAAQQVFLAQLDDVSTFFSAFMETRVKTPSAMPSFTLGVQFRVNREHEKWANNILEWRLTSGPGTIALEPGTAGSPPIWTYPQPVQLSLRFAQDGQVKPLPPEGDPYARLQDLTLTWDYTNPWSVLRLVEDHPTPPENLPSFTDTNPKTLELKVSAVEIVDTQDDQVKEGDSTDVLAYLRITFARPDDATVDLPFPNFPIAAPALPASLSTYNGTTSACDVLD